MITFEVENGNGQRNTIEVPKGINLNLMEVLRASGYPIEATCGGMALCATCYVEVMKDQATLCERSEAELDMLDTLPSSNERSRLSCQIKIDQDLQGVLFKIDSIQS